MDFQEIDNLRESREGKAMSQLSDAVNSMSFNARNFANAARLEHRTLQQSIFRCAVEIIKVYASDDYTYDGRNQASHELAKKIVDTGVLDYTYLPTI